MFWAWSDAVSGHDAEGDAEVQSIVREEMGINRILGLFDTPAFARRGQEVERAIGALDDRCREERARRLKPVEKALRAWALTASGPDSWESCGFAGPVDGLWVACDAEPCWGSRSAPGFARRRAADALVAAVRAFNGRWPAVIESLGFDAVNALIDGYNRFYLLEKECVVGSPRLAARLFRPLRAIAIGDLLARYPLLPDPEG